MKKKKLTDKEKLKKLYRLKLVVQDLEFKQGEMIEARNSLNEQIRSNAQLIGDKRRQMFDLI